MDRKHVAFQLEKTVPGTFLVQGLLGGVLGGLIAAFAEAIALKDDDFGRTLDLMSLAVFAGGIIGMIKATLMLGVVRLTGIQYRTATRVAATGMLTAVGLAVACWQTSFDEAFCRSYLIWACAVGTPVALLVGSRVKPWELFTFGSIAAGEVDHRSGSRSILGTLGTLPLRFLSITASILLVFYLAPEFARSRNLEEVLLVILFLSIVGFYPFFSAFLTFRSPRKIILCVIGAVINFPLTLIFVLAFLEYLQNGSEKVLTYGVVSASFIVAWLMFLIARLGTKLGPTPSLSITSNKSIATAPSLDHQCLGSRFAEWQQRLA